MRVLGLNGSPHTDGITARLLDAALAGAKAEGGETKSLHLYTMKIAPSDGCPKCVGTCTIHDDNDLLYSSYRELDALVVSLPIYFENVPGHVKAAIDRCQALWMDKHLHKNRIAPTKRPGAAIITAGSNSFAQFGYTWHVARSWFTTIEVRMSRSLFVPNLDEDPGRERAVPLLEEARRMGGEIAVLALGKRR